MWNRVIPAPEIALWRENGIREYRTRVRRRGEASWTDLSSTMGGDWVLGIRADIHRPDQPAASFDVRLLRRAREGLIPRSLSPGLSAEPINLDAASEYRPFIHPGREIEVDARVGDGATWEPWRLWLKGEVEDSEWPGNEVIAKCVTLDGVLLAKQIEVEELRGAADPGVPIADEIQGLINRWWQDGDPPTLRVIGAPGFNIGEYRAAVGSLGEQIRRLAQRRAWDVRYLWSEADGDYRLTLYLPPRDKVDPDFLLPVDEVAAIPGLSQSRRWVRNAIRVPYVTHVGGAEQVVTVTDADSIDEYRRQPMVVPLSDGNEVPGTEAEASALGTYAIHDLARPLIDARYRHMRLVPWLELHDLLAIEADGARFDQDRLFSIVGGSYEVTAQSDYVELELRGGSPAGQYFAWHRFAGLLAGATLEDLSVLSVDLIAQTSLTRTYRLQVGRAVEEIDIHWLIFQNPLPDEYLDTLYSEENLKEVLSPAALTFVTTQPAEGEILVGVAIPRGASTGGAAPVIGNVREFVAEGGTAAIDVSAEFERLTSTTERIDLTVTDPRGIVSSVVVYETLKGVVTGPFTAALSGATYRHTYTLDPDHVLYLRVEVRRSDGIEPLVRHFEADYDEVPGIPAVREVRVLDQVSLYVDAVDTDSSSLWYQEVIAGTPGAEVEIPARGSDPRFGAVTFTVAGAEREFRIYAKNDAGVAGEYRDVVVERYIEFAEAAEVAQELTELGNYIDGAFLDGVISAAEAKAIAEHLRQLNTEKADLDEEYAVIIANPLLLGTAATNLTNAKTAYDTAHADLVSTITMAIADGAITPVERTAVDASFTSYEAALGLLSQRFAEALEVIQPAVMQEDVSEDGTTGTLTLVPVTGAVFDTVEFATRSGNGAWSAWVDDPAAPYSATVALHPKHASAIAYRVSRGAVIVQQRVVAGFDVGTIATVLDAIATPDGSGTANLRALFDTDTVVGAGEAQYRVDGGAPVALTVAADRTAEWTVAQSTTAEQLVEVQGRNAAGSWGPWFPVAVPRYVATATKFPRITVARATIVQQPIVCGGSGDPITNRIHIKVEDQIAGYTLKIDRYENGEVAAVVDSGLPLTTTQVDDQIPGYVSDINGSFSNVSYLVQVIGAGPPVDPHSAWTQVLPQPRTVCP